MPVAIARLVWSLTALSGVTLFGGKAVLEEVGDTTDRVAPNLMMIGGGVALVASAILLYKAK